MCICSWWPCTLAWLQGRCRAAGARQTQTPATSAEGADNHGGASWNPDFLRQLNSAIEQELSRCAGTMLCCQGSILIYKTAVDGSGA